MKTSTTSKLLMVLTALAVIGFGAYAFAGWDMGYGHHGWMHDGYGWHHGAMNGPGYGYMMGDLSDTEIATLEKERNAFFTATEDLRQALYAKQLELTTELNKENPNTQKAADLQKEISSLEAKLDQKRIDYLVKLRKINPNAGRDFIGGGPMMGYGGGYMMGYGPSYGGGGYCWR